MNNPLRYMDPTGQNPLASLGFGLCFTPVGNLVCGGAAVAAGGYALYKLIGICTDAILNMLGSGGTQAPPVANNNTLAGNPPKKNDNDPCEGLRKQLAEHQRKLSEYIKDPLASDNKGILAAALAGGDRNRYNSIYSGRIANLKNQIENFKKQLAVCEKQNGP
jgi:hypothetical protein